MLSAVAAVLIGFQSSVPCRAALLTEFTQVRPGQTFRVAVKLTPNAGWHTYWQNPGDSGMATSVAWTLPYGWKASPIEWPVPEVIPSSSGANYGYGEEVVLPIKVTVAHDAPRGQRMTLRGKVQWLACKEACIMGTANLALSVSVGSAAVPFKSQAKAIKDAVDRLPVPYVGQGFALRSGEAIELNLGRTLPQGTRFYGLDATVDPDAAPIVRPDGGGSIVRLHLSQYAPANAERLRGLLVAPNGKVWERGTRALAIDVPIKAGEKTPMTSLIALALISTSHFPAQPVAVGAPAPDFSLPGTDGKIHTVKAEKGHYLVLEWTNKDCPFVKKHYGSGNMQKTQATAVGMGVVWYSIVSSAPGKQGYVTKDEAVAYRKANKVKSTTTLLDPDGAVGHLYEARTTPQIVVIDPKGMVIYSGAIDDRPTPDPASLDGATNYVLQALKESKAGKAVSVPTTRPYGCSVKYAD